MINSNSEYVSWARSGTQTFAGLDENGVGAIHYYHATTTRQFVSCTQPAFSGNLGAAQLTDNVERVGNALIVKSTTVRLFFSFSLAFFLALAIDWGTREPIIWTIQFNQDKYTAPFTLPVFDDPISYSFAPPASSLSAELRQF